MSVERLREAVTLLRERAEAAITDLHGSRSWHGIGTGYREPIKKHISTMSPVVALALADWLDAEAHLIVGTEAHPDLHTTLNPGRMAHLEAVANAILGATS